MAKAASSSPSEQRLVRCLTDEALWECYLTSLAERPDLSILNLASVAIKRNERGYESCADMRTKEAWTLAGAALRRGVTRDEAVTLTVPRVTDDGTTVFEDVDYWPRACVVGAPRTVAHAPSVTYDLSRPADIAKVAEALAEARLDDLASMSVWAVYRHFGFPTKAVPQAPSADDLQAARRMLAHVSEETKGAIDAVERTISERRQERMRRDEEMVAMAHRDARRLRALSSRRDGSPQDRNALGGTFGFDPEGTDAARKQPAMPQPRRRPEAPQPPDAPLTILEEKPREAPPVLPLEQAVEEVRAKLFPKGKK